MAIKAYVKEKIERRRLLLENGREGFYEIVPTVEARGSLNDGVSIDLVYIQMVSPVEELDDVPIGNSALENRTSLIKTKLGIFRYGL